MGDKELRTADTMPDSQNAVFRNTKKDRKMNDWILTRIQTESKMTFSSMRIIDPIEQLSFVKNEMWPDLVQ